ncbi:MAG: hypothetical protein RSB98_02970 [Raoultibacter sp.]
MTPVDHVWVLGTYYTIEYLTKEQDKHLKKADGYCDCTVKRIVIAKIEPGRNIVADLKAYARKCLRHEIVHAFFYESGLTVNSTCYEGAWARCEEMVDWWAIQHEKIHDAFLQAGALEKQQ